MKALTVRQPYAGAIAHQTKRVENRGWKLPAKHEGARILIHAGAKPDKWATVYGPNLDVYGAVVAVATITGCHFDNGNQVCCSYWAQPGVYHWELADVIALPEPVPAKGALGFWTPTDDVLAAVEKQLAEVARWKTFLCKHSFPCQPPHGSIFRPGPCGCGLTYEQHEAELRRQEEALIVGTSRDGQCPDCNRTRRLYRFQPPAQPWHEPDFEPPVTFLCNGCFNAAADAHNAMVNGLFEEAAR